MAYGHWNNCIPVSLSDLSTLTPSLHVCYPCKVLQYKAYMYVELSSSSRVRHGDHSILLAGPCVCACCGVFDGFSFETEH